MESLDLIVEAKLNRTTWGLIYKYYMKGLLYHANDSKDLDYLLLIARCLDKYSNGEKIE